jgi:hypothetical protein
MAEGLLEGALGGEEEKPESDAPESQVRIPRDGEQRFHGIVNTDSTAT